MRCAYSHPLDILILIIVFEIACHGNRWRNTADLSGPDEEAEHVRKSIKRLQKASGLSDVPKGWFLGNGSNATKVITNKWVH